MSSAKLKDRLSFLGGAMLEKWEGPDAGTGEDPALVGFRCDKLVKRVNSRVVRWRGALVSRATGSALQNPAASARAFIQLANAGFNVHFTSPLPGRWHRHIVPNEHLLNYARH